MTDRTSMKRWTWFLAVAGVLLTLGYAPLLGQEFLQTWDDGSFVEGNAMIRGFSRENLIWAFSSFHGSHWIPLSWLSLNLDYSLWGYNPLAFKLHNLLLHIGSGILVVLLLHRISTRSGTADRSAVAVGVFIAGLLFLIHPQHVESVAWVSERKDVLCSFFYLLSLYAHLRAMDARGGGWAGVSLLMGLLALLAKPMAVTLPVALTLIDLHRVGTTERQALRSAIVASLRNLRMLYLLALVVALVTIAPYHDRPPQGIHLPPFGLMANAAYTLLAQVWNFFVPFDLSPLYPTPDWIQNHGPARLIPVVVVVAITVAALGTWHRGRTSPLLLLLFFIITLLPTLALSRLGYQSLADRYAYIPTLPLYLGVVLLWEKGVIRWGRKGTVVGLAATLIGLMGLATVTRSAVAWWRTDVTLWERVVNRDPGLQKGHVQLAQAFIQQGDSRGAEEQLRLAQAIDPSDIRTLYMLSTLEQARGRTDEALDLLDRMVVASVDSTNAIVAATHQMVRLGRIDRALAAVEVGLDRHPMDILLLLERVRIRSLAQVPLLNPGEASTIARLVEEVVFSDDIMTLLDAITDRELSATTGTAHHLDLISIWEGLSRNKVFRYFAANKLAHCHQRIGELALAAHDRPRASAAFVQAIRSGGGVESGLAQASLLAKQQEYCMALGQLDEALQWLDARGEEGMQYALSKGSVRALMRRIAGDAQAVGVACESPPIDFKGL